MDNGVSTNGGFQLFVLSDTTIRGRIDDSGANGGTFDTTTTVNDGIWHHVALVADKSDTAKIYLDGFQDGTTLDISSYGDITGTGNFQIGNFIGTQGLFSVTKHRYENRQIHHYDQDHSRFARYCESSVLELSMRRRVIL